ncbi:cysteine dioxygenase type I [Herbihabitans rhizosphaerae]|uniref:Cysteine dioxygenase type I n=1 Tax=Herbihabitans rhizosphaerae TaxID=1872711 RepID=A0A4Q7KTV6_9PSEU|nr:cysteine dioxygenase family protein [Herbihabitans rhizosphaerae]RZS39271.1 cysteine dioxygenase type I [Herbihabitans rhizosphaerae]
MFSVPENTIAATSTGAASHPVLTAHAFAEDRARWAHLLRYDPDERFSALVEHTDEHEVWLMSWLPGQGTDLHDHGEATGAFTVVSGVLTERVARRGAEVLHTLSTGQSRVFAPNYVHQVTNAGVDPAITIHVYRSERRMTSYRDALTGPEPVDS